MPRQSKYPELNDEQWLRQKYEVEGLSASKIGELINTSYHTVILALNKLNITQRYLLKTQIADLEWLKNKYYNEKMSCEEIGRLVGYSASYIRVFMKNNNIPTLSPVEKYKTRRKNDGFIIDKSILEGRMLGDGWMYCGYSNPVFCFKNKYYEYVKYCYDLFHLQNVNIYTISPKIFTHNGREINSKGTYSFQTLSHTELLEYYKLWYPNNNKKQVIPKNINIDETVLLHWYLDKGNCYTNKYIVLSTHYFIRNDIEWLCEQFNDKFDLGMRVYKDNLIYIPQIKSTHFFRTIGECPIECMKYKWKTDIFD